MNVSVEIKGLAELENFLKKMPDEFNYKFMTGVYKGTLRENFYQVAKMLAPVGERTVKSRYASRTHEPGNLRDSITIGLTKSNRKMAAVWCGVQASPFGRKRYDAYYAHMVEFGHNIKKRIGEHKKGIGGTYVRPRPFMRPAWDGTVEFMKKDIVNRFFDKIKKFVKANGGR